MKDRSLWMGIALFALGLALGATLRERPALAQGGVTVVGSSCSRGDLVVYDGSNRARCTSPERVELLRCSSDELLGTDSSGRLRCVGPSSTSWDVRGLLPDCTSGATLVSEGFGRWRCQSP